MAGDHKCPVCQSTFTRPQHVARHMRSHTGDRPYKCQHCGDQFARSDLLSRHINKCHASEKPPTTTAPSRRKGTAAASRATTSKQACDQCVTSSLPCDGANPCTKCVHRKCRCTYVKFHRQTAPAGPGHPLPPTIPTAVQGRHGISLGAPRLPDDFFLAPPPGTMNMYASAPNPYSLSHISPAYPPSYNSLPPLASALAPSESPIPGVLHRENIDNADAMARIRAQAELLGRTSAMPNGALNVAHPALPADSGSALPGLYAAGAAHDGQFDRFNVPGWDQQRLADATYGSRTQTHAPVPFPASGEPTLQSHPPTSVYQGDGSFHAGSSFPGQHPPQHHHSRSDDMNSDADYGSDAGSASTHSIPSSTNSSTIQLPLPGFNNLRTRGEKDGFGAEPPHPHDGEGGFSSAFGLMSLDDPNVLAGLAADGQPFFSSLPFTPGSIGQGQNGLPLATPTQDLLAQLKSAGGREGMDSKEMRDFWKQYLRTPLTGPNASGSGILFPLQTPTGPGAQLGQQALAAAGSGSRPSPTRRHSRVASLPSMKTPPIYADERLGAYQPRPSTGDNDAHHGAAPAGYGSAVRTTLHDANAEDLKSYEQAVLARGKAPMQLNLVPRRKGSLAQPPPGQGQGVGAGAMGKSKSMSPVVPHASFSTHPQLPASSSTSTSLLGGGGSKISELLNRPGSSSSASSGSGAATTAAGALNSSLAHAFGGSQAAQVHLQDPAGADAFRPSFKRLASQTLAPDNAKRAQLNPVSGWGAEDEGMGGERSSPGDESEEERRGADVRMAMGRAYAVQAAT